MVVVAVAEVVAAEAAEGVAPVAAEVETKTKLKPQAEAVPVMAPNPNIKVPPIQIFRRGCGKGAPCTSSSGSRRTSVRSQAPAHGKMCLLIDLKIETGTSP